PAPHPPAVSGTCGGPESLQRREELLRPAQARLGVFQIDALRLGVRPAPSASAATAATAAALLGRGNRTRLTLLTPRQEPRKLPGGRALEDLPRLGIAIRKRARRVRHDDLEIDRLAGAPLDELAEVALHVDVALAHAAPLHFGAAFRHPDVAVAHVAREHVGGEHVERQVRILDRPHRVARIDRRADEVGPRLLDQALEFARLHVAGVILDADLDARIDDARPG